jgi:hypothetical protein
MTKPILLSIAIGCFTVGVVVLGPLQRLTEKLMRVVEVDLKKKYGELYEQKLATMRRWNRIAGVMLIIFGLLFTMGAIGLIPIDRPSW